jgi:hypothetical protein
LSQAFSPRYVSWTNDDPHRSGFKFQTAVLSVFIIIIIIIIIITYLPSSQSALQETSPALTHVKGVSLYQDILHLIESVNKTEAKKLSWRGRVEAANHECCMITNQHLP